MTSYRVFREAFDSKKEEYEKYFEESGVSNAVANVLENLFNMYLDSDKPKDAFEYVRAQFGVEPPYYDELKSVLEELDEVKSKIETVNKENEELKSKLKKTKEE